MPVDLIAMLGCHLVTYLCEPQARKASMFTLTFEVGVFIYNLNSYVIAVGLWSLSSYTSNFAHSLNLMDTKML